MEECGLWEDVKGPFSVERLDGFYLANSVLNLQSGFGVEYILLAGLWSGYLPTSTAWLLWHRWHSTQEENTRDV